jgi:hypothetical protein
MESTVYVLCAITAGLCSLLLLRQWRRTRLPLIFWAGIAFLCFTANNVVLFIDLSLVPDRDLSYLRQALALAGAMCLTVGIIRSSRHA